MKILIIIGLSLKKDYIKKDLKNVNANYVDKVKNGKVKKMSLILDHINGIHNDNRIENLRIVCPNCNATLDTHAGKNINRK